MSRSRARCPGPVSRRSFLEIGSVGLGGLALADFLRLRAEASTAAGRAEPDTSVIMLWLPGGLPHMDMYDMKPEAPEEFRGPFSPVKYERSRHRGLRTAAVARQDGRQVLAHSLDLAQLRRSRRRFQALHDRPSYDCETTDNFVNEAPAGASIVAKVREHLKRGVPHNVMMADSYRVNPVDEWYAMGAAYLGPAYRPFELLGNPSAAGFQVKNLSVTPEMAARLDDRQYALERLGSITSRDG